MTAREVWEGMLVELSNTKAPSLLLSDFNYFFNKAINQYVNKQYNIYDINQQTTDSLRVLKATTILTPTKSILNKGYSDIGEYGAGLSKLLGGTYEAALPMDYLHMLNCICIYNVGKTYKCFDPGNKVQFAARRLTADSWSIVMNDYYNRPLPERPYFYIHNVNQASTLPTNPYTEDVAGTTDMNGKYSVSPTDDSKSNLPRKLKLREGGDISTVEKAAAHRYGNGSTPRIEIRYGHDDSVFKLEKILIDYIKAPQHIRLTQEQVNLTEDTSQIMEYPDYVCQEIINELTKLIMANAADPRLQSNAIVSQSIASPAQQGQPTNAQA